jgi:hypothetical protein
MRLDELDRILAKGGSIYRVSRPLRRLERRTSVAFAELADKASLRDPQDHLQAAREAAYGRHLDAAKAYDECIRAVESVAIPLVLPAAKSATLGKVLSHFEDGGAPKWELAITGINSGDVAPAVVLISLLWRGHVGRHAGTSRFRPQRPEEAQMAFTIAATLVEWFGSGAIRRRETV